MLLDDDDLEAPAKERLTAEIVEVTRLLRSMLSNRIVSLGDTEIVERLHMARLYARGDEGNSTAFSRQRWVTLLAEEPGWFIDRASTRSLAVMRQVLFELCLLGQAICTGQVGGEEHEETGKRFTAGIELALDP